jgi:acyl-CoA synthetase (AMP-forming)/AMP-acid ligase II
MNVAAPLLDLANKQPQKQAVVCPLKKWWSSSQSYEHLTFYELEKRSLFYAHQFLNFGLKRGDRVLVFIKPCLDFSVVTFALFRAGLVPIFIDPGMGKKMLLEAIDHIKPQAMIAEPAVFALKLIYRHSFRHIKVSLNIAKLKKKAKVWNHDSKLTPLMIELSANEEAAILFTSGGTGRPKGVLYTHSIFNEQRKTLKEMFHLSDDDIDMPGFPLFALFTITMGMTSVIPLMNPAKPAQVNPKYVVKNIQDHAATFIAGSPAIWQRVGEYCRDHNVKLESVKYLVMFGAPVSVALHHMWKDILPSGDTYTPYGATESLPVTCLSGRELDHDKQQLMNTGSGTCVGQAAAPSVTIRIAPITDEAIKSDDQVSWHKPNVLGEICVQSPMVTPSYVGMPEQTSLAKIISKTTLWHRMGDLGYLDEHGQLWFCGRKSQRLIIQNKVVATVPLENIVNNLSFVKRSALIQIKDHAYFVIEHQQKQNLNESEIKEITDLLALYSTLTIKDIFTIDQFPVDVRHNIKIDRKKLAISTAHKEGLS